MRKILITTRLVLISLFANASGPSQLSLTSADNHLFSIAFDQSGLSSPTRFITVNDVEPGYHHLYIIGYSRFSHISSKSRVLFNQYVYIPASSIINASIGNNQSLRFVSILPVCTNSFPSNPAFSHSHFASTGPIPICNAEFTQLQNTIASKSFDSSKLQVAMQAIASNHFTSKQISDLMQLMTFESSKLELAKAAFNRTVDKQNYYRVNDSFTFESSIDELNRFIRNS